MWTITATQSEDAWFDDLIVDVLTHEPPALPAHDLWVGHVECSWYEVEPGVVHVASNPETGSIPDRRYAERLIFTPLANSGFKRASVDLRWDHSDLQKHSAWGDIEEKAKRLVQTGAVTLGTVQPDVIKGTVAGDGTDNDGQPDTHQVEIKRQDPTNMSITGSHCDCGWGQFQNLPRTRMWKRFQNRPCSHVLATWWQALALEASDQSQQDQHPDQGQLFDMSPSAAPSSMGLMRNSPMPNPNAWFMQPGAPPNAFNQGPGQPLQPPQPAQAPSPADVLPQFQGEPIEQQLPPVNPASTPGGRPGPTPTNPIQYPGVPGIGGTFSRYNGEYGTRRQTYTSSESDVEIHSHRERSLDLDGGQGQQEESLRARIGERQAMSGAPSDIRGISGSDPTGDGLGSSMQSSRLCEPSAHEADESSEQRVAQQWPDSTECSQDQLSQMWEPTGTMRTSGDSSTLPTLSSRIHQTQDATVAGQMESRRQKTAIDQQYQNGDLVRLSQETVGTLVGRSEEHGAGQQTTIPAGSVGEVLGTDPTTQMVNVLFMGKQFNTNSYLEPFGVSCWCWPSELTPSSNRPPGPAIRRTHTGSGTIAKVAAFSPEPRLTLDQERFIKDLRRGDYQILSITSVDQGAVEVVTDSVTFLITPSGFVERHPAIRRQPGT